MTPIEWALARIRPIIGRRWADWIKSNLPSRKPQLWEAPYRAVLERTTGALKAKVDPNWGRRPLVARLQRSDLVMELLPQNDIDVALLRWGVYEISGTRFVQTMLEPGMTFVDVGANSGYYSLLASRKVGSHGCVCAVEPAAGAFARLQRNLELNKLHNVTTVQAAVTKVSGQSIFYPSIVERNDGLGSLLPGPERAPLGTTIRSVTLTEVVDSLPGKRVDLVKVDVEGGEADVFIGGQAVLRRRHSPALLFESWDVDPIVRYLTRLGYEVRHVHFSLATGLEFPHLGGGFESHFAAYEPPSYVAVKSADSMLFLNPLSARSRKEVRLVLRLLATLA